MATQIKTANSHVFTKAEQALIISDLMALKKAQISEYLASVGLNRSGAKEVLRDRIEDALDDGSLSLSQIVQFLDSVIPWGKQHVYLYKGPQSSIAN